MAKIVSMSLNEDILRELDLICEEIGFSGRSEAVRASIKSLSSENTALKNLKGKRTAVIMVVNKHSSKVNKIIHNYPQNVITHLHNHLDEKCLDLFVFKGDSHTIKKVYDEMQKEKTIDQVKISVF